MLHIKDLTKPHRPVKIIQFGGGVFLRGFFDVMAEKANSAGVYNGNIIIVRSKTSGKDPLSEQNFNYTHIARDGENTDVTAVTSIIGSVSPADDYISFLSLADTDADVIVSNTTEAGISYIPCEYPTDNAPESFPAKLTALLYKRFSGCGDGFLILPCELIENNGDTLKNTVLRHADDWKLGEAFKDWLLNYCSFRNTLVDRIVSGLPSSDEKFDLGYEDGMINTSEYFHLFCIEGERDERLPFDSVANVKWVNSVNLYRKIKVRILNGAHTSMIPYAMVKGIETVGDCLRDAEMSRHLSSCLEEIILSLDISETETRPYADEVIKRFSNPHIRHLCSAISLNSVSKFAVRVTPSILDYRKKLGKAPTALAVAVKMLIEFYKNGTPRDSDENIDFFRTHTTDEILSSGILGADLSFLSKTVLKDRSNET